MKTQDLVVLGRFIYNRVGYKEFKEILRKAVYCESDKYFDTYVDEKWELFKQNTLSFLINNSKFTDEVLQEIKKQNYNG